MSPRSLAHWVGCAFKKLETLSLVRSARLIFSLIQLVDDTAFEYGECLQSARSNSEQSSLRRLLSVTVCRKSFSLLKARRPPATDRARGRCAQRRLGARPPVAGHARGAVTGSRPARPKHHPQVAHGRTGGRRPGRKKRTDADGRRR